MLKHLANLFIFLLLVTGTGCKAPVIDKKIEIIGHIKNIPNGKVYLANAFRWDVFLDSAVVKNDSFCFRMTVPPSFEPYYACISYIDSAGRTRSFSYINRVLTTEKQGYRHSAFVLEPGVISINGALVCRTEQGIFYCDGMEIKAGKETEVMYKHQMTGFGRLGTSDSSRRAAIIRRYSRDIKEYPMAYTLLQNIYDAKEEYTDRELENLLSLFNKEVQHSGTAARLKSFMDTRTNFRKEPSALVATDTAGNKKNWIAGSSRYNLLVFWASWCGPCRSEIPVLKNIHAKFNDKDVHMTSISIDKNTADWMKAVRLEAMSWEQVKVDSAGITRVKEGFNFSAIPLTVITDHTGKEIKRYSGFGGNTEKELISLFEELLKNK
ncbi:AhpC/TSA family protein [Chitinophaga varians]|uniref:AhpC/TSA family protein n=1 Tax=Chitinophaga varians TaxID=2202339 RepID=A0A847S4M5_9BACT|nr:TlpA disulfide reductase family protein [Chitinophaga varians]NLR66501.1 AhpC/TSA family protein [Chitinophaga varians]